MISTMKKMLLSAAMLALSACATGPTKAEQEDASANSVKVTNMDQNHGGTGIILYSSPTRSIVLTNSHVCGVVEEGGLVSGMAGNFMVESYKKSNQHDLCLIKVAGDLQGGVKLAKRPPVPYYEAATISGHPSLYPNVKTYGHFSGRQPIQILTGFKACTEEEMKDPSKSLFCMMLGGLPIVKEFDAVLVTATIMPGSSGSGVYNEDMELTGVAFAGSGSLGYAWTVPYQYVRDFVTREAKGIPESKPADILDVLGGSSKKTRETEILQKLENVCSSSPRIEFKQLCELLQAQMLK